MKNLKKYIGLIPVALFAILLGCGGGGGGGGSNGTTNGTTCTVVNFTAGQTNAQPGDTILGQVTDELGCVMPNVPVKLFDNSNNLLTTAFTNAHGYWRAPVSTTATKAEVDGDALPNNVYKGFQYGTQIFQAATTSPSFTCKVPLPALTIGVLTQMPNGAFRFYLLSSPPPPPPSGCIP